MEFPLRIAARGSVSLGLDTVNAAERGGGVFTEEANDFVLRPHVENAFPVFGFAFIEETVGIFRGVKAAGRIGHVPAHVIENIARRDLVSGIVSDLKGLEIRAGELGLIVEHFFEVRHMPEFIHRVAVKSAAEVVVHAAVRHLVEGKTSAIPSAALLIAAPAAFCAPSHGIGN